VLDLAEKLKLKNQSSLLLMSMLNVIITICKMFLISCSIKLFFSHTGSDNDRFWSTDPLTGTFYQINFQSALTWHQARQSCEQQDAELLSVTEIHEQTYLRDLIDSNRSPLWIGLNSLNLHSGWQWSGGTPFRYFNWAPGSPSPEPEKLCAVLNPRRYAKWENRPCEQKVGYICKKENSTLGPSKDAEPVKCPEGWLPYAGHCYIIHREPRAWKDALMSCNESNGNLASIHNPEEHAFVLSQLGYKAMDELWLGMNDLSTQMYFEWSDETPVTYTKWLPGEPTHAVSGQEDCVVMAGEDGYWADSACDRKLGYICRREPLQGVSGTVKTDPACTKGWTRHGSYCYLVGHALVTFSEAVKTCERIGSYLTTVEDRYEQAYLTSFVGLSSEKCFWIGLSNTEEQEIFKWETGEGVFYTNWNSAMPGKEVGCVALRTGSAAGLWDVQNCELKAKFLCKKTAEKITRPFAPGKNSNFKCPLGWNTSNSTNSCFRRKKHKKTWFEARDFCREIGGDLAAVNSEEEQRVIENLITYMKTISFYDTPLENCGAISKEHSISWINMHCEYSQDWICEIKKGRLLSCVAVYEITEDGWIIKGDKQYFFSTESTSMEKARMFCRNHHGDLAIIGDNNKRIFLWKYILKNGKLHSYLIGLILNADQQFRWIDGTTLHYAPWAEGEPNFAFDQEYCVVLDKKYGLWNDVSCGHSHGFICERHGSFVNATLSPAATSPPGGCPKDWLLFKNQCYKFFGSQFQYWYTANKDCINLGGHLATIQNEQVQAFLTYHLKDVLYNPWIGLNDIISELNFVWADGSAVSYTNWAPDSPKLYEDYADIGKWSDESCYKSSGYICQKNSDPKLYKSSATVLDFAFDHSDGISYSVTHSKMNWEEAQQSCKSNSSELASILDPYSQSLLFLIAQEYGQPMWIGLNSYMTEGKYRWIDRWRLVYSKWSSGEPKQTLACVYLDTDGTWKTASCKEKLFSICKKSDVTAPAEPPHLPGNCPESKGHKSWIPFHGHCYYFEAVRKKSWSQAHQECMGKCASLVSIEDPAEMNFLLLYLSPLASDFRKFWIGLFKNIEGEWMWTDRSVVEFVNWEKGEPTMIYDEHCVDMDVSSGSWRNYYCSVDRNFICKIPKTSKREPAVSSSHSRGVMIVTLIFLLLAGTGLIVYFFYKKRHEQTTVTASFGNAIYCGSPDPGTHESKCLVTNIEENE
uniref:C-type lectin domain-containing protein n=1 Tax=Meleagris gallopavo TaxID=9103 RepID=A0A803YDR7_MELGA